MPPVRKAPVRKAPVGKAPKQQARPDYEAPETLVVAEPEQLRALADGVRTSIIAILREHARSTQELAADLGIPKGTVGHHLKVLERAGLIRVVRTRKVRALTEKYYGRTAKLFLFQAEDPETVSAIGAAILRQAALEIERATDGAGFGHTKVSLTKKDVTRLERRLKTLMQDFREAEDPDGEPYALITAMYKRPVA